MDILEELLTSSRHFSCFVNCKKKNTLKVLFSNIFKRIQLPGVMGWREDIVGALGQLEREDLIVELKLHKNPVESMSKYNKYIIKYQIQQIKLKD